MAGRAASHVHDAVDAAVRGLDEPRDWGLLRVEMMQDRETAGQRQLEQCAETYRPAAAGDAVEVTISRGEERSLGEIALDERIERMHQTDRSLAADPEHGSVAIA